MGSTGSVPTSFGTVPGGSAIPSRAVPALVSRRIPTGPPAVATGIFPAIPRLIPDRPPTARFCAVQAWPACAVLGSIVPQGHFQDSRQHPRLLDYQTGTALALLVQISGCLDLRGSPAAVERS